MPDKTPPTYEELAAMRAKEWEAAQARAAADLNELHQRLRAMPDVAQAPSPDVPWSHPDIVCPCGGTVFRVSRWVTVNGLRHRAELRCQACKKVDTWDWTDMRFLPWA